LTFTGFELIRLLEYDLAPEEEFLQVVAKKAKCFPLVIFFDLEHQFSRAYVLFQDFVDLFRVENVV